MSNAVRVGIIGLGRRWRRHYRPALERLSRRFQVQALCEQVQVRAAAAAKELGCSAAAGPTDLLERDDVEAVLLLDPQWYGLWPLDLACRLGKPVLCCSPLRAEDPHAEVLRQRVRESGLPVLMGPSPRLAPASHRLRELLAGRLGAPRLLLCDWGRPRRAGRGASRAGDVLGGAGVALADWCVALLGGEPRQVQAACTGRTDCGSVFLEYADGRGIQITSHSGPGVPRALRLRVVAERGSATVYVPGRVCWSCAGGRHSHRLPRPRPLAQLLLKHFWQVVRAGASPEPGFEDAYRALGWLRAAAVSRAEGRRVALPAPEEESSRPARESP